MIMKKISKIFNLLLVIFSLVFLLGCNFQQNGSYQTDIQNALNESYIEYQEGDSENRVTGDIKFRNCSDFRYEYRWESNNLAVIDNQGNVTRTEADTEVIITLTVSSSQFSIFKDFKLIVRKIDEVVSLYTFDLAGTKSALSIDELNEVSENQEYTRHLDVIAYIHLYHKLPSNYLTKSQAKNLGWRGSGNVWTNDSLYGKCIGGDTFNNREQILPITASNTYIEVDVNCTNGNRGGYRIVYNRFTFDIYYTEDHYETFIYMIGEVE